MEKEKAPYFHFIQTKDDSEGETTKADDIETQNSGYHLAAVLDNHVGIGYTRLIYSRKQTTLRSKPHHRLIPEILPLKELSLRSNIHEL